MWARSQLCKAAEVCGGPWHPSDIVCMLPMLPAGLMHACRMFCAVICAGGCTAVTLCGVHGFLCARCRPLNTHAECTSFSLERTQSCVAAGCLTPF